MWYNKWVSSLKDQLSDSCDMTCADHMHNCTCSVPKLKGWLVVNYSLAVLTQHEPSMLAKGIETIKKQRQQTSSHNDMYKWHF